MLSPAAPTGHPITVAHEEIAFDCPEDATILEAAEAAGWSIPYSCRKGVCDTCTGSITSGEIIERGRGPIRGPTTDVRLCRASPLGPVEIAPRRIRRNDLPERRTLTVKVHRIRTPAPRVTVLELRFPLGRRVPFRAGQYLMVQLPDGDTRAYSMANPPHVNDAAEIHVRTEAGGRFSDLLARNLRPGDRLTIETPFGESSIPDGTAPLLLLATGTGFAPARSLLLDQATRRTAPRQIHLYWGGRTAEDLYQWDEVRRLADHHPWLTVTAVLSRPEITWTGETGRVQDAALRDHPDLSGHVAYACGSPNMIADARTTLVTTAALPPAQFHADAFVPSDGIPLPH